MVGLDGIGWKGVVGIVVRRGCFVWRLDGRCWKWGAGWSRRREWSLDSKSFSRFHYGLRRKHGIFTNTSFLHMKLLVTFDLGKTTCRIH